MSKLCEKCIEELNDESREQFPVLYLCESCDGNAYREYLTERFFKNLEVPIIVTFQGSGGGGVGD